MPQTNNKNQQTASQTARRQRRAPKKRRARGSTKVFYTALLAFVLIFIIALTFLMSELKDWLIRFEASQPDEKCNEVFTQLFAEPNWEEIYGIAEKSDLEPVEPQVYAAYMNNKVGDNELTCIETSAGLSGDKKYIVRCDSEKLASFTLVNSTPDASIDTWELGVVEIFYDCDQYVNIIADPSYTVMVNGKELDDSYVIRTESTKAEKYLPEDVHGYRLCEMSLDGLLTAPTVEILDTNGNPVELNYDVETCTYTHTFGTQKSLTAADEEYQTLLTAAKTYGEYMLGEADRNDLKQCFDSETEIYNTITTNTTWMQKFTGYEFGEETIDSYYRYSDDLYSAKLQLILYVTRKDGTIKEYDLNNTFFVEKKSDGQWLVTNMINTDAQELQSSVRLTYVVDGETVSSELVDAQSTRLSLPEITVPEGKTFAGWFTERVAEDGKITMDLVFPPSEDGTVSISAGTTLEPMVLQARFQ